METDEAVEHNERAMRQTLLDIQLNVQEFMKVDKDQVLWELVSELSQVANTINLLLHPESAQEL